MCIRDSSNSIGISTNLTLKRAGEERETTDELGTELDSLHAPLDDRNRRLCRGSRGCSKKNQSECECADCSSHGPSESEGEMACWKATLYCCTARKATVWALWPGRTPWMIFMKTKGGCR